MDDVFSVIDKKLALLKEGGCLLTTGRRFNQYDIEVRECNIVIIQIQKHKEYGGVTGVNIQENQSGIIIRKS